MFNCRSLRRRLVGGTTQHEQPKHPYPLDQKNMKLTQKIKGDLKLKDHLLRSLDEKYRNHHIQESKSVMWRPPANRPGVGSLANYTYVAFLPLVYVGLTRLISIISRTIFKITNNNIDTDITPDVTSLIKLCSAGLLVYLGFLYVGKKILMEQPLPQNRFAEDTKLLLKVMPKTSLQFNKTSYQDFFSELQKEKENVGDIVRNRPAALLFFKNCDAMLKHNKIDLIKNKISEFLGCEDLPSVANNLNIKASEVSNDDDKSPNLSIKKIIN